MSVILTVPTHQLLQLWGELVEAYHGVHGYGGHVAEIYAYRLMPYTPTCHSGALREDSDTYREATRDVQMKAGAAFVQLCSYFTEHYPATILLDDLSLLEWWDRCVSAGGFAHRVHAHVQPTGGPSEYPA